jgi:hypothetical protein
MQEQLPDAGGTSPWMGEGRTMQEQLSRAMHGAKAEAGIQCVGWASPTDGIGTFIVVGRALARHVSLTAPGHPGNCSLRCSNSGIPAVACPRRIRMSYTSRLTYHGTRVAVA